jgi:hypothetical protein
MRYVAAITLLAFLWATAAQAEMKLFPLWTEKKCDGETWGCYTFEQMQKIMKIDLDLQLKLGTCEVWEEKYTKLDTAYLNLRKAYDLSQGVRIRLETRLDEKTVLIRDLSEQVHKYANRDIWGSALPWVIVGLVVSFAGGVVAGVYLSK